MIIAGLKTANEGHRPKIGAGIVLFVCVVLGYFAYRQVSGFQQEDIDSVAASIKAEFEKRDGVEVRDVKLIRESSNKLVGFVALKADGVDVTKPCEATMDDDDMQLIWRCE